MAISNRIPQSILKIAKIYGLAIAFFTLFRVGLLLSQWSSHSKNLTFNDLFQAFIMGWRFDTVIASYFLALPFLLLTIGLFVPKANTVLSHTARWITLILFTFGFGIAAADIPYFNQFFSRFSVAAFEWTDSPKFVFKMIIEEPKYWLFIIPFFGVVYLFSRFIKTTFAQEASPNKTRNFAYNLGFSLLAVLLLFVGIRGRLAHKSPIRVGTAYFSNNAFINQLGLNANFTFLKSYLNSQKPENQAVMLMDNELAVANVQHYLGIKNPTSSKPLARHITFNDSASAPKNVVIVIMESMSAEKMSRHANPKNLTPFLDSLSYQGYYFENAYSAGIHTFNGIFSTLFSMPALFRQHPMKGTTIPDYQGIFESLEAHHYSSIYFTTHDGQFDNVEGFLKANYCDDVIAADDYPSNEIKTTLGVPDDYMFEFAMPKLNNLAKNSPFCAALMTASDHGPYYVPPYFKPKYTDIKDQIVEYADYSLQKFINLARQQPWFDETLFVFVADHGAPLNPVYAMPLAYNHTPLLFYCPKYITKPQTFSKMASQIDIFPTVMNLLQKSYVNNTLGIDLLTEERPYVLINGDDKYGVLDSSRFLLVKNDGTKHLYDYKSKSTKDYLVAEQDRAGKMEVYGKSHLQAYQYVLKNNLQ